MSRHKELCRAHWFRCALLTHTALGGAAAPQWLDLPVFTQEGGFVGAIAKRSWMLSGTICASRATHIQEAVNQIRLLQPLKLKTTLERYVKNYNQQISQRALNHLSPIQALKEWQKKKLNCSKSAFTTSLGLTNS